MQTGIADANLLTLKTKPACRQESLGTRLPRAARARFAEKLKIHIAVSGVGKEGAGKRSL
jgi:hypothetical protein